MNDLDAFVADNALALIQTAPELLHNAAMQHLAGEIAYALNRCDPPEERAWFLRVLLMEMGATDTGFASGIARLAADLTEEDCFGETQTEGRVAHRSGDHPFTIRSLVRIAGREGYDFDAPLAFRDDENDDIWLIRGIGLDDSDSEIGQCIEMDRCPPEDWHVESVEDSNPLRKVLVLGIMALVNKGEAVRVKAALACVGARNFSEVPDDKIDEFARALG